MTSTEIFDATPCTLGEGPLWHPERAQLFWFDIIGNSLLTRKDGATQTWGFAENVSAAGWVGRDLIIASESALFHFNPDTGARDDLLALEADRPDTRSNDGRADPFGGFWIGTMSKDAQKDAGAIYRYYRGEVRRLFAPITIPNAICFTPDGRTAHFTDTASGKVMRVALGADGWPTGTPEVFLDLTSEGLNPDGAVIDAAGTMWLAQWGASRVAAYGPDGAFIQAVAFDAPHTSCPAFGGADMTTLYCTTAREGMSPRALRAAPNAGQTFMAHGIAKGQPEHEVTL